MYSKQVLKFRHAPAFAGAGSAKAVNQNYLIAFEFVFI
jgi:hypothetical protein